MTRAEALRRARELLLIPRQRPVLDRGLGAFTNIDPQALAARLASRQRRCYVHENIGHGYHLLVIDDGAGFILAEEVGDWEAAVWLAALVNEALLAERCKARRARP